jgi:hypothetical protein
MPTENPRGATEVVAGGSVASRHRSIIEIEVGRARRSTQIILMAHVPRALNLLVDKNPDSRTRYRRHVG